MDEIFINLTDDEIKKLYEKYKNSGMSEDDIFTEIYANDCNLDNQ